MCSTFFGSNQQKIQMISNGKEFCLWLVFTKNFLYMLFDLRCSSLWEIVQQNSFILLFDMFFKDIWYMKYGNTLKVIKGNLPLIESNIKTWFDKQQTFILIFKAISDSFSYLKNRILILYENDHFIILCRKAASF